MSYTISDIPEDIEQALRQKAANEGRSMSEVSIEALRKGVAAASAPARRRDLQDIVGSWVADPETDRALAEQRVIDPQAWRWGRPRHQPLSGLEPPETWLLAAQLEEAEVIFLPVIVLGELRAGFTVGGNAASRMSASCSAFLESPGSKSSCPAMRRRISTPFSTSS